MQFKYRPWYVREGDKFIFREGKTKGIGTITRILEAV
jgi:elongation factor 1-alpha